MAKGSQATTQDRYFSRPPTIFDIICTWRCWSLRVLCNELVAQRSLLVANDVSWYSMVIQTCWLCQLCKTQQVSIPPVVATPAPLFSKIYMGTMHLTPSSGYKYIIQGHCSLTHWPEWEMLRKESAKLLVRIKSCKQIAEVPTSIWYTK